MLRRQQIGFWLLLAAAARAQESGPPRALYEPERGCYLGAFIVRDHVSEGNIGQFELLTGKHHVSYINYSGYGMPFPAAWVAEVGRHEAAAHIAWEPNDGLDVVRDDAYLRAWAQAARRSGVPIFLRFASEMNGNWMPYSGDPQKFIAKWRLVAQVMREEAPNVAMVWCVFSQPLRNIPVYYPGDEWVDWVGVNIYSLIYHNNDPRQPAAQEDPRDELRPVYDRYAARKPIMVCEYAATTWCRLVGRETVDFALEKMTTFYRSLPTEFPRVKAVHWFSVDALGQNLADNNYSLTHEPRLLARYWELVRGDWFLTALENQPQPPGPVSTIGAVPEPVAAVTAAGVESVQAAPPAPPGPTLGAVDERPDFGLARLRDGEVVTRPVTLEAYFPAAWNIKYVSFRVNGKTIHATNHYPFECRWDPSDLAPGRYELSVRVTRDTHEAIESPPVSIEVRRAQ